MLVVVLQHNVLHSRLRSSTEVQNCFFPGLIALVKAENHLYPHLPFGVFFPFFKIILFYFLNLYLIIFFHYHYPPYSLSSYNHHTVVHVHEFFYLQQNAYLKINTWDLVGLAQWIDYWPANQRVTGSIPSQGTCLGCGPGP